MRSRRFWIYKALWPNDRVGRITDASLERVIREATVVFMDVTNWMIQIDWGKESVSASKVERISKKKTTSASDSLTASELYFLETAWSVSLEDRITILPRVHERRTIPFRRSFYCASHSSVPCMAYALVLDARGGSCRFHTDRRSNLWTLVQATYVKRIST